MVPGLQADHGLDGFSAISIRHADDGCFADGRVLVQHFLYFARPHLEARRDDHVLRAIDEVEPAVLVHEADVAGLQSVGGDGLRRGRRVLPVARDDLRAGDHELADLAWPALRAVFGDDLHVRVEHGHADRHGARVRIDGRDRPVRRHVSGRCRFGQAVHRLDAHAGARMPVVEHGGGRRCAAGVNLLERREVALLELAAVQEGNERGHGGDREGGAVDLDEHAGFRDVEAVEEHERCPGQQRQRDMADEPRHVEQRRES